MRQSAAMTITHTMAGVALAHALCLLAIAATPASAQPPPPPPSGDISSCLVSNGVTNFSLPSSPSYTPLLDSSIRNLRFENNPTVGKPAAVVLPATKRDLQLAILCARNASLAIRVRSGGHSYEGLSYTTENHVPFAVIDLANLNNITVDAAAATAWVESGATLGELYHAVGLSSSNGTTLAFSAGSCATVGVGGHVAGGGFGLISRKFGLAADNVLDAVLIAPDGSVSTRATMDADVFWAIRGGGGGSFGVVYAWKLRLVAVPGNITVFTVGRTGPAELVAGLIHRWQLVAPNLPDEFYLSTLITPKTSSESDNVSMSFTGQVLGPKRLAMAVLGRAFPELGLAETDLAEVSWVESAARFAGVSTVGDLTSRQPGAGEYAKRKSDYVRAPIPVPDAIKILRYMAAAAAPPGATIQLDPYGGAMARVGSAATPFPHRAGYLYSIQYAVTWNASVEEETGRAEEDVEWLRAFYDFMAPYVTGNPRAAYVNYLDLDLGTNGWRNATGGTDSESVRRARSWGERYFAMNFDRLVRAKTKVDPGNVFNNAQSIPPLQY